MNSTQQVNENLAYVKRVVQARRRGQYGPVSLAVIWAIYIAVSYSLADLIPLSSSFARLSVLWVNLGMLVAVIASWMICYGMGMTRGEVDRPLALRHSLHWTVLFLLFWILRWVAEARQLDALTWGQLATLLLGISFIFGGLHLDRRYLPAGLVLIIGAVVVEHLPLCAWTAVGVVGAFSLVASTIWIKPRHG